MVGNRGKNWKQTLRSLAVIPVLCAAVGATLVVAPGGRSPAQGTEKIGGPVGATLVVAPWGRCLAQDNQSTGGPVGATLVVALLGRGAAQATENIDDITGKYQFLSADDTLGILEEEGKLKGYIEVQQGEEESDIELTYEIISGSRKNGRVEFKTNTIHRKYYRFSGKVERGSGQKPDEPDYLRLVGDVETVTVKGDSGQESVERIHLILKSLGKSERNEE